MKLRPFELALVVIFSILFVVALLLLKTYQPAPDENVVAFGGAVSIWGTLPAGAFAELIDELSISNKNYDQVSYRFVPEASFSQAYIEALADGSGPDLILIPHELLVKNRSKIESIPYESFPVRDFRSIYSDGAEIFALNDGIYGFPIAVDPLVLYWNRDIFSNKNLLTAPTTWEDLIGVMVPELTMRDNSRNIRQASLAMGSYTNVKNAFPIISMLLLQGGSQLVTESNSRYQVNLDTNISGSGGRPFTTAINFFTNFSSISNTLYTWNRSLAEDKEMFLREELSMYFGLASEGVDLEAKNPNLNFDIAEVPQGAGANFRRTYGKFYTLAVSRATTNKVGAYTVLQELGSQSLAKKISDKYNLAPVHRASLIAGSNNIYGRVAYASAPIARGWLNPEPPKTDQIMIKLLEDISSNRSNVSSATSDAITRLEFAY